MRNDYVKALGMICIVALIALWIMQDDKQATQSFSQASAAPQATMVSSNVLIHYQTNWIGHIQFVGPATIRWDMDCAKHLGSSYFSIGSSLVWFAGSVHRSFYIDKGIVVDVEIGNACFSRLWVTKRP